MVLYGLYSQGQQQLLLLQQRYAMMEHHLQQQQKSPTSPGQRSSSKEEQNRPRQINCVYFTEAKPAFNFGTESAAPCTSSGNLPSSSPTVHAAVATSTPATTTRTSFMISDILERSSSRSSARTCSTASCSSSNAPEEANSRSSYCEDPSRDSPRSIVSDDAEAKERDHREDSIGSDSDVERSGQAGK